MAYPCVRHGNNRYTGRVGHKALTIVAQLSLEVVLMLVIHSLLVMT